MGKSLVGAGKDGYHTYYLFNLSQRGVDFEGTRRQIKHWDLIGVVKTPNKNADEAKKIARHLKAPSFTTTVHETDLTEEQQHPLQQASLYKSKGMAYLTLAPKFILIT